MLIIKIQIIANALAQTSFLNVSHSAVSLNGENHLRPVGVIGSSPIRSVGNFDSLGNLIMCGCRSGRTVRAVNPVSNNSIVGSTPTHTANSTVVQLAECLPVTQEDAGSSPVGTANNCDCES